jgi:uncharacterized protein YndB with AHSA1/START domain
VTELIDTSAPVISRAEIEIAAPPDVVWEVLTDFNRWPTWNAAVKSMSAPEPVAVGSVFRWKAGPGRITSTIQHLEPPRLVAWSGRTTGIRAIDVFRLEARDGTTFVREEESWGGPVARMLRKSLQRTLDRSLQEGVRALKDAAEHRDP